MYLTRAFLDPSSHAVRADLRDPEGLHKTVMRAFPDDAGPSPRRAHAVLYRLDHERSGRMMLLLSSRTMPMTDRWPTGYLLPLGDDFELAFSTVHENPAIRNVEAERAALVAGHRFAFRLLANTTKKIDTKTGSEGARRHGRRVPVRGDEERLQWFARHAEAAGFVVEGGAIRVTEVAPRSGRTGKSVTVAGALFEGVLVVRDADRFRESISAGIGPGKAYGFGLLSIARPAL